MTSLLVMTSTDWGLSKDPDRVITFRQRWSGSHRYSVILSTRMHPIVRTASALISGFGSWESCSSMQLSEYNAKHESMMIAFACILFRPRQWSEHKDAFM